MTTKIIIDTNFLLMPHKFGVDIFEEIDQICNFSHELYIFDKTIDELDHIIETRKGDDKRAAKIAKMILNKKNVQTLKSSTDEYVDDLIVNFDDEDYIVATNDMELVRRLKKNKIKVIRLRQKKYLVFEQ